ncbi:MAG: hypothetical protein L6R39_004045 [Caloplaca ligustica]|nr:MAG: hypothetical protein L6R39_004045 [Caloplaca ligustica]
MAAFGNHQDFWDLNWPGALPPPIPPQHAPGPGRKTQIVWPRDKKQGGAHTARRWRDIFTSKGPDMWVGKQGDIGPTRPEWSGWDIGPKGHPQFDNLGYWDERDKKKPPWRYAHRDEQKRYNFRSRKYEEPDHNTWTDVKWDRRGRRALYWRLLNGSHFIDPELAERLLLEGLDHGNQNPFQYDPDTNWWNYYVDRLPLDFPAIDLHGLIV